MRENSESWLIMGAFHTKFKQLSNCNFSGRINRPQKPAVIKKLETDQTLTEFNNLTTSSRLTEK